jgi:hypothetical protein
MIMNCKKMLIATRDRFVAKMQQKSDCFLIPFGIGAYNRARKRRV